MPPRHAPAPKPGTVDSAPPAGSTRSRRAVSFHEGDPDRAQDDNTTTSMGLTTSAKPRARMLNRRQLSFREMAAQINRENELELAGYNSDEAAAAARGFVLVDEYWAVTSKGKAKKSSSLSSQAIQPRASAAASNSRALLRSQQASRSSAAAPTSTLLSKPAKKKTPSKTTAASNAAAINTARERGAQNERDVEADNTVRSEMLRKARAKQLLDLPLTKPELKLIQQDELLQHNRKRPLIAVNPPWGPRFSGGSTSHDRFLGVAKRTRYIETPNELERRRLEEGEDTEMELVDSDDNIAPLPPGWKPKGKYRQRRADGVVGRGHAAVAANDNNEDEDDANDGLPAGDAVNSDLDSADDHFIRKCIEEYGQRLSRN